MVYGARAGWYRATPDQNVFLPHDVLRILIQLLAWGDLAEARRILPGHKTRLFGEIQDRLDFEQAELRLRVREEVNERITVKSKLVGEDGVERKKAERDKLEKRLARLDDILAKTETQLREAAARSQKEREAVDAVEVELLAMFADPEQRKRYFAIVDVEEIAENDFNLNIPRYVDTFEPESAINVIEAQMYLRDSEVRESQLRQKLHQQFDQYLLADDGSPRFGLMEPNNRLGTKPVGWNVGRLKEFCVLQRGVIPPVPL